MKRPFAFVVLLLLCFSPVPTNGQHHRPPGLEAAQRAESRAENSPDLLPASPRSSVSDPAQLKRHAEELAKLADSIVPDIERVNKGVLPKELNGKLKRIEKLSKQLRSELSPN